MNLGLLEHMDRRSTPCAWCGKPSTHTLIVEPARDGTVDDIRVGSCDKHRREPEPLPAAVTFHRRSYRGSETQMGFDLDV